MSIKRGMDKGVVHIYNGIFLSHRKEQNNAKLQQHGWRLSHWVKSDTEIHDIVYMWSLKKTGGTNKLLYKTEVESWVQKTNMGTPGGQGRRHIGRLGLMHTDSTHRIVTSKDLLCDTQNSAQRSVRPMPCHFLYGKTLCHFQYGKRILKKKHWIYVFTLLFTWN